MASTPLPLIWSFANSGARSWWRAERRDALHQRRPECAAEVVPSLDEAAVNGRLVLLLGALSAFGPLSMDMYLPGLPSMARDLSAPALAAQVLEDCRAFAQGELYDDCALVVLKRTG